MKACHRPALPGSAGKDETGRPGSNMTHRKEFTVAYHAVCLIDVLGQKDNLAAWGDLPVDGQLLPKQVQALKKTSGTVLQLREWFEDFFHHAAQCTMPDLLDALPQDKQRMYLRIKECTLNIQQFSDTFVFYAPLPTAHGDVTVVPLYRMLGACCLAMQLSLAARMPVRGAITIGAGMELDERNFYGPALAEVHHLESEVAQYPRIVVAAQVKRFLAKAKASRDDSILAQSMRQTAGVCESFLCDDTDGYQIVDFVGQGVRRVTGSDSDMRSVAQRAHAFVHGEYERFQSEGNEKLQERYARLMRYMEQRLPLWTDTGTE